jgi:hypothetical protein
MKTTGVNPVKKVLSISACIALLSVAAFGAGFATLVHFEQGGSTLTVESGGAIAVKTGGSITYNGVANTGVVKGGSYDDTANTTAITTGLSSITTFDVKVIRSGKNVASDTSLSASGGTLTVADGSSYTLTNGDVIKWIAIGS